MPHTDGMVIAGTWVIMILIQVQETESLPIIHIIVMLIMDHYLTLRTYLFMILTNKALWCCLDDSDRLGYYGSLEWAVCDRNNRNVAFTLVDPWATIYDDVGVAYWVGPDAYLVDVDLVEDLSEINFVVQT